MESLFNLAGKVRGGISGVQSSLRLSVTWKVKEESQASLSGHPNQPMIAVKDTIIIVDESERGGG